MVSFRRTFLLFLFSSIYLFAAEPSEALKIKKIYPLGEKIYTQKCSQINPNNFNTMQELETEIQKIELCDVQNQTYISAVAYYLWDVKRDLNKLQELPKIVVHNNEKCPVCGMFVYKYPRWVAQMFYKNKKHHSFDGMKDLLKFYFDEPNKENIEILLVKDYYSQETINAMDAYYVVGSDVYGPMGEEFIAFSKQNEAQGFYSDHRGKKILYFQDITKEEVYKLDE